MSGTLSIIENLNIISISSGNLVRNWPSGRLRIWLCLRLEPTGSIYDVLVTQEHGWDRLQLDCGLSWVPWSGAWRLARRVFNSDMQLTITICSFMSHSDINHGVPVGLFIGSIQQYPTSPTSQQQPASSVPNTVSKYICFRWHLDIQQIIYHHQYYYPPVYRNVSSVLDVAAANVT